MFGAAGSFISSLGYNSPRSNRLDHPEPTDFHRVVIPPLEQKFSPNENYSELHEAINKLLDKNITISCLPRHRNDRRWFDIMSSFNLSQKQVYLLIKLVERKEAQRMQASGEEPQWQPQEPFRPLDVYEPFSYSWDRQVPPLPTAPALHLPALPAVPRYSAGAFRREGNSPTGGQVRPGPRIRSSNNIRDAYRRVREVDRELRSRPPIEGGERWSTTGLPTPRLDRELSSRPPIEGGER